MKTKTAILISLLIMTRSNSQTDKAIAAIGPHRLGGYVALAAKSASVFDESAGIGDARAAVVFNGTWAVGLAASGLYYDKRLTPPAMDGTCHFYAGYSGLFIERIYTVGPNTRISLSWLMAQGLAYYQYDKEYRREKVWSEEVIDAVDFYMNEPALQVQQRVAGRIWLGVTAGYRWSSPVWLIRTPEDVMRGFSAGLSVQYAIY